MAYEQSKGMLAIATGSSGDNYTYTKLDKYVGAENISITPGIIQDLDSYRNANGLLKRKVLPYRAVTIQITTPFMRESKMDRFMEAIEKGTKQKGCSVKERKVRIRYYDTFDRTYKTAFCYIPNTTFTLYSTSKGYAEYNPTTIEWIGYGEKE